VRYETLVVVTMKSTILLRCEAVQTGSSVPLHPCLLCLLFNPEDWSQCAPPKCW
jgi:hypothetical protein